MTCAVQGWLVTVWSSAWAQGAPWLNFGCSAMLRSGVWIANCIQCESHLPRNVTFIIGKRRGTLLQIAEGITTTGGMAENSAAERDTQRVLTERLLYVNQGISCALKTRLAVYWWREKVEWSLSTNKPLGQTITVQFPGKAHSSNHSIQKKKLWWEQMEDEMFKNYNLKISD